MAEVVGLVISGVGLLSLVKTVTECFEKIDTGRNLGKDYEQYTLQLKLARLAYDRWLQVVTITEPNNSSSRSVDSPTSIDQDAALVKKLLENIEATFKDAEKVEALYNVDNQPANTSSGSGGKTDLSQLEDSVQAVSKKRQKNVGVRAKFRWVFRDKKALEELVAKVTKNVHSLTTAFPTVTKAIENLAAEDLTEIAPSGNTRHLELLKNVARDADPVLEQLASQALLTGHMYYDVVASDRTKVLYGNQTGEGGVDPGYRNIYKNAIAKDDAKVQYGSNFNMKRDFWDD